ncbi:hypothetical protein ISN45_Un97g000470 (mitochondrion) [Arabidopsis thaliana x Arabidopsis arenosa]|nr:hypothetical protein ISN45_Un97g000470 [Arabidopsis thaliana x Arabidopsis arenosa]
MPPLERGSLAYLAGSPGEVVQNKTNNPISAKEQYGSDKRGSIFSGESKRRPPLPYGKDSNLQSSGHEPDEFSSSTQRLPLLFLSQFPPRSPALLAWPG